MTAQASGRRALVTIGSGEMAPVLDRALPGFDAFAARHGYDVVVGDGDSGGRPAAWGKVQLLRRLLPIYDFLLWLDADILIVDGSEDLPALPEGAFQGLVEQRRGGAVANTGVWALRSCQTAKDFLDEVWNTDVIDHPWWEQARVMDLLGYVDLPQHRHDRTESRHEHDTDWYRGTFLFDSAWNSLFLPWARDHDNPRFWHFAAMTNRDRLHFMAVEERRDATGIALFHRKLISARWQMQQRRARLSP